jgi:hypothetical protein
MTTQAHYSKHASLALMAQRIEALRIWATVCEAVQIAQKVRIHQAMDKLLDCWINMLMGGRGLIEVNTRLRTDVGLQRAFGRASCAEQSTISDTLDACRPVDVAHLREALKSLVHRHGAVMRRPAGSWLVLDVDTMGLVAGAQGEGVTKGFFSGKRDRRGRQLGWVLATDTDEIVAERLYAGTRQLETSLMELVTQTETTLMLSDARESTVWRVDAGGGSDGNINAMLQRGYHVLTKVHSWQRAQRLARSVQNWVRDPRVASRDVGWVSLPHGYVRPTRQLVIRTRDTKGKFKHRVLVTTLSNEQLGACFKLNISPNPNTLKPDASENSPWFLLYAYDLRGGGIETQNRCDQQGLGLAHRNKRRFVAQEMLVLLAQLAHNVLIWMRNELTHTDARFAAFGLKRMVRDVLAVDGVIHLDVHGQLVGINLNPAHPLAASVAATWNTCYE